jgi:hypothetical protein
MLRIGGKYKHRMMPITAISAHHDEIFIDGPKSTYRVRWTCPCSEIAPFPRRRTPRLRRHGERRFA